MSSTQDNTKKRRRSELQERIKSIEKELKRVRGELDNADDSADSSDTEEADPFQAALNAKAEADRKATYEQDLKLIFIDALRRGADAAQVTECIEDLKEFCGKSKFETDFAFTKMASNAVSDLCVFPKSRQAEIAAEGLRNDRGTYAKHRYVSQNFMRRYPEIKKNGGKFHFKEMWDYGAIKRWESYYVLDEYIVMASHDHF